MPSTVRIRTLWEFVVVGVLALALIAAPLWVPGLHLDEPTVTYERAEVVVDHGAGITYANDSIWPSRTPISEEIGCLRQDDYRTCNYEIYLQDSNATVPAGWTNNPSMVINDDTKRYEFVQFSGETYRTAKVVNESVQDGNGFYRLELALEPVAPETVLSEIARPVDHPGQLASGRDVPDPVVEAARTGSATSREEVEVPPTVFEADDGRYYRVFHVGTMPASPAFALLEALLTVLSTATGLGIVLWLGIQLERSPPEEPY